MAENRLLRRLAAYDHRISTVLLTLLVIAAWAVLPRFWLAQMFLPVASVVGLAVLFVLGVRWFNRGRPRKPPRGSWGF